MTAGMKLHHESAPQLLQCRHIIWTGVSKCHRSFCRTSAMRFARPPRGRVTSNALFDPISGIMHLQIRCLV
jgi:hypothetical protein